MRPGALARAAVRGSDNYRNSTIHDRVGNRCRFSPSCSHYADEALRTRRLPVALLLIAWRLLRCTRLTPFGTVDRLGVTRPGRRRRIMAVLALSGITTLLVAGTAAAVGKTLPQATALTGGGCTAFVGGQPVGLLNVDHPLQVHKGQRIVVTGQGPAAVARLNIALRAHTDIKIHFIEKIATRTESHDSDGQTFQKAVNVDNYLKYGSGVYRVDVHSVAPGAWDCSTTFYVEMHGSKLAAEVAVAVGAIGTVAMVASARGGEPDDTIKMQPDDQGVYDPEVSPEKLDIVEHNKQVERDRAATGGADAGTGCLAAVLFALIASTGAFAMAVPPPSGKSGRVWVKGHPILGFLSGLIAGLGFTVALWQFNVYPLTVYSAIVAPVIMAVLGGWRGWRGTAWKYV